MYSKSLFYVLFEFLEICHKFAIRLKCQYFYVADLKSKKEFFHESEIIFVTASVYYQDSSNRTMVPSEISILKFSIRRGIYDHRHYILGFAENRIQCTNPKAEAEENGIFHRSKLYNLR